jgi:hypothetical protein
MQLNPKTSIPDTLKQAQTEKLNVEVYLRGGQCFKGPILGVAEHTAIIGPLLGKEFFDVQVKLEDVIAVSLQTRDK